MIYWNIMDSVLSYNAVDSHLVPERVLGAAGVEGHIVGAVVKALAIRRVGK
jgi:hypothetical protein